MDIPSFDFHELLAPLWLPRSLLRFPMSVRILLKQLYALAKIKTVRLRVGMVGRRFCTLRDNRRRGTSRPPPPPPNIVGNGRRRVGRGVASERRAPLWRRLRGGGVPYR